MPAAAHRTAIASFSGLVDAALRESRRALSRVSGETRTSLVSALLAAFGFIGALFFALTLAAEDWTIKVFGFFAFALFSWAAVVMGEAAYTPRRDRLIIAPEGMSVLHLSGRYFVPWSQLAAFRVSSNGMIVIADKRSPYDWRYMLRPLALDPACHDMGGAAEMCAELNQARDAGLALKSSRT
jgi:hypothetical protein